LVLLLVLSFQKRISIIPIFIAQVVWRGLQAAWGMVNGLGSWMTSRPRRDRPVKEKGMRQLAAQENTNHEQPEEPPDVRYQPSLPSESNEKEMVQYEPLEIIHNKNSGQQESLDFGTEPEASAAEDEADAADTEMGFEVLEPHQEKELDYDTLVRNSLSRYQFPSSELLTEQEDSAEYHLSEDELKSNARLLEETLSQFGVKASVNRVVEGPVITMYEVKPATGVKISQIVNLADDLALAMRAKGIRMIAPIPGKAAIGIEIPNRNPSVVSFRSIMRSETFINFTGNLPFGVGKTISGEVYCSDLARMPHLLMAGATGSGKSVGINTIISSLLYRVPPSDLKFVMIDPKKLELSIYSKLKDHYLALCPELDEIVITTPQNAIMMLRSVVNEMEERYDKLAALGVREITHYNRKIEEYYKNGETSDEFRKLPFLVVVIDELADLILTATREVEEPITRLAQMARAVGIHLIMATQRPSVDILTGLIKANFPARIAYQVATRPDSKVILDMYGAEKLIGNGDMLFLPPGKMKPIRVQNPLITTEEVERIIRHIRKEPKFPPYELKLIRQRSGDSPTSAKGFDRDELYEEAMELVVRHQSGSVSLLQRKLKIGYSRAARIVDQLEEAGIVGPASQEGKARDVLVSGYSQNDE
ncbi:MAG: DNA translocase FtsK, partial [Calditrichia bacterium]